MENRIDQLGKAIVGLKPPLVSVDPTTNFWTTYKKIADEYDNALLSQCTNNLNICMQFGLSVVAANSAMIALIASQTKDPLALVSNTPTSVITACRIFVAGLCISLLVVFMAGLAKRWISHYTRVTTLGNIIDQGKERHTKLIGLQKWGFHAIVESLLVLLQFGFLIFGIALVIYLWDLKFSAASVALVVTSVDFGIYICAAVAATVWSNFPFQTPLSVLLLKVLLWMGRFTARACVRSRQLLKRVFRIPICWAKTQNRADEGVTNNDNTRLSNPAFWRKDPLFASPVPEDIAASAAFWSLENSTDLSVASAIAAAFCEFQWPSHYPSTAALIRFRDMYMECFRAPEFNSSTRLRALQSAAAYYILYHTQLIWSTSKNLEDELGLSDLPPDLFLHEHRDKWDGYGVFEYLLRVKDRSEPVTSARFLSYIAPYWFCGDPNSAIALRPARAVALPELIKVLEESQALTPVTLANCVLSIGVATNFPLHPEDLVRVDKSTYLTSTFEMVVEHIHRTVLDRNNQHSHTTTALNALLTLVEKAPPLLCDAAWINELLKSAAGGMDDENFALFLRLSTRREGKDAAAGVGAPSDQDHIRF
ncbi:hypothetical protein BDM02DRAFT_3124401 [Thelephora ganbajun]|uniref:Uncharacterized protein n=1 Tax=Thelephora ganbajun TaxID=370292 RepID=A0ACB6YZ98_THEGA|nr:hypothetical protein BDM02DRAFT_3124401 [Thelephora ganbajun]